jgi:hypothetical protein
MNERRVSKREAKQSLRHLIPRFYFQRRTSRKGYPLKLAPKETLDIPPSSVTEPRRNRGHLMGRHPIEGRLNLHVTHDDLNSMTISQHRPNPRSQSPLSNHQRLAWTDGRERINRPSSTSMCKDDLMYRP